MGHAGDDSLVAIDGGTSDEVIGNEGSDTMWIDLNWNGGFNFSYDTRHTDSLDTVQIVSGFANGADRSLDGDDIVDPSDATNLKDFSNNWLFADWGPSINDVDQQDLGDCWLMAAAGAVAYESPNQIREIVADFGDGTYGVKLGGKFYRVDADLATWNATSTDQRFAGLGMQNSLWVAIVEKAYAHFRTGENTYASLNGGDPGTALAAYGVTDVQTTYHAASSNDADAANNIYNAYRNWKPAVVSVGSVPAGSKLVGGHAYTVVAAVRNSAGVVTSITLRNPWGGDDTGGNPFVTVTPAELGECEIWVQWGNV